MNARMWVVVWCVVMMSMQWSVGEAGEMWIHTFLSHPAPDDCTTNVCTESNPCGPQSNPTMVINIAEDCIIRTKVANWDAKPIIITATNGNVGSIVWESRLPELAPQHTNIFFDIQCAFHASCNVDFLNMLTLDNRVSVNTTGTVTFTNSKLRLSAYVTYIPAVIRGLGGTPVAVVMHNTQVIHFGISPYAFEFVNVNSLTIDEGSSLSISTGVSFSDSTISSLTIEDSTATAESLFRQVEDMIVLSNTTFSNLEGGLLKEPTMLPPVIQIVNCTWSGDASFTSLLWKSGPGGGSTALVTSTLIVNDTIFNFFAFSNGVTEIDTEMIMSGNTFNNMGTSYAFAINAPAPAYVGHNSFVRPDSFSDHMLELSHGPTSSGTLSLTVTGNSFSFTETEPPSIPPCDVLLPLAQLNTGPSESEFGVVCLFSGIEVTQTGPMEVTKEIRGALAQLTASDDSVWTLRSNVSTSLNVAASPGTLIYEVRDATLPAVAAGTSTWTSLPDAFTLLWLDEANPAIVGSVYPIITGLTNQLTLPMTLGATTVIYDLQQTGDTLEAVVAIVHCPSNCDEEGSEDTCLVLMECNCKPGYSGRTCAESATPTPSFVLPPATSPGAPCTGASPGPSFDCIGGQWVSNTSIEVETLVVPGGSGPITVLGDVNVTQSITFEGLGSELFVNGCVIVSGEVIIVLTPEELETLKQNESPSRVLITSNGDIICSGSTDLSTVHLSVSSSTCDKVSATNTGSATSLNALFTIDSSGCKKKNSNLVAIVVPSVVGGVLVLSAVALLIGWRIRANRLKFK